MLRTLLASHPNFVSVPVWSEAFHFSVNVRGAALAVPFNAIVFFKDPDVIVKVPLNDPDVVGENFTVTEPPVLDNELLEIENPVPEIEAVGVAVRFAAVTLTALVEEVPSTQEKSIDVGFTLIVGSGVDTLEPPAGLIMLLFSNTKRS